MDNFYALRISATGIQLLYFKIPTQQKELEEPGSPALLFWGRQVKNTMRSNLPLLWS